MSIHHDDSMFLKFSDSDDSPY